jgi:hypothetical protein
MANHTNKGLKVAEKTRQKSMAAMRSSWLCRKVIQPWREAGRRRSFSRYLETV